MNVSIEIQNKINFYEKSKDNGWVDQALYLLNDICVEFRKVRDWEHVQQYAREGIKYARNNTNYAYESAFLVEMHLYCQYKRDINLLRDFIKDYIITKERELDYAKTSNGYELRNIEHIEMKIRGHKRILEEINNNTFVWPNDL
jgi:hypothetical protein